LLPQHTNIVILESISHVYQPMYLITIKCFSAFIPQGVPAEKVKQDRDRRMRTLTHSRDYSPQLVHKMVKKKGYRSPHVSPSKVGDRTKKNPNIRIGEIIMGRKALKLSPVYPTIH